MSKTILVIGTLDTKSDEFIFLRSLILERGHKALLMDVGVIEDPNVTPDIRAEEVAEAGGSSLKSLRAADDRGAALDVMGKGACALSLKLLETSSVDGVISMGGSGGTSIATTAMLVMPVGLPKVMVSTMAAGDVSPYVGVKDVTMMYSVVDVAGLNSVSRKIYANAAGAICGMVEQEMPATEDKPLITASMFGVTTPCVDFVREKLEEAGYEILVFHATGSGGRAMESLINDGFITASADITTSEWCDELFGGVLSAGPTRLDAAIKAGIPQVVSLGALDMVNFAGLETVPDKFKDRNLIKHNPSVTLMRTNAEENKQLGEVIAKKLNQATAPTSLFVPLKGVSMVDAEGQPFYSPEANEALFDALRCNINTSKVTLVELDMHINDASFAEAMANQLMEMLST